MTAHDLLKRWPVLAERTAELRGELDALQREHEWRAAEESALRQELARLIRVQPSGSIVDAGEVWTVSGPVENPRLVRRPEPRRAHTINVRRAVGESEAGVAPGRPRIFPLSATTHDHPDGTQFAADVAEAQAWARNCAPARRGA
jgi:hypothetical protein